MAREKGMGNLQKEKSGRWTMRVCIKGKRYSRTTRTTDREKAERFLQRFLAPFGLGEHRLPLAEVWNEYIKSPNRNELATSTLHAKRNVWMHFAKWMEHNYLPVEDLAGVTPDAIAEYLASLRANLCGSSYNNRVCVLREIFRVLADKAGLDEDPWYGVRLRPDDSHSRRELTTEELRRLLKAAKEYGVRSAECGEKCGVRREVRREVRSGEGEMSTQHPALSTQRTNEWHTLFLIGIYTGLRLGDCCKLDWSQINIAQSVIQLMPQKTRRHHGRIVTIPIHPALGQALLAQGEELKMKNEKSNEVDATSENSSLITHHSSLYCSGPVLPSISEWYRTSKWRVSGGLGEIFKAAYITTSIKIEGRRHKTPEATFHSLRHTFVSFAANAGVPLHIVQSIVGHESTAMTRHYYHENIDALKSAVAAIPTL